MAVVVGLALVGCSDGGGSDGPRDTVAGATAGEELPPDELQTAWWTWSQTAPEGRDPVADPTGEDCSVGQPDDLWLLAGTYGGAAERTCDVPSGRVLVAPAVNLVTPERADCAGFLAAAEGAVTVDGVEVELERIDPVQITFESSGGPERGFACGLWAQVAGLQPGEHRIEVTGSSGIFRTRVDYTITVG